MRFLSICSGIEAASVAFAPLGWKALALSEIEAFPRAVLKHHYPDVPLHGDFTALRDQPWIVGADMLCGGTPCQAFSIAGLRQSLADERGNLTLEFVRLADAIDDLRRDAGLDPAWILWENVPGVLSVADNAFGAFLAGLCGHDAPIEPPPGRGWTDAGVVHGPERVAAWRVLDAQHFGLAQRRRRVFVLARRHPRGWDCADALLPLIQSLHGHPAPRREAGQRPAPTISARTKGGGGLGTDFDCDGGLIHSPPVSPALKARDYKGPSSDGDGDGDGAPLVVTPILDGAKGRTDKRGPRDGAAIGDPGDPMYTLREGSAHAIAFSCKDYAQDATSDCAPTLRSMAEGDSHPNGGGQIAVAFNWQGGGTQTTLGYDEGSGVAGALHVGQTPAVAYSIMPQNSGRDYKAREVDVAQPVMAGGPVGGNQGGDYILAQIELQNQGSGGNVGWAPAEAPAEAPAFTLSGDGASTGIAFALRGREGGAMPEVEGDGDTIGTLRAADGGSSRDYVAFTENQRNEVRPFEVAGALAGIRRGDAKNETLLGGSAVRRLTPEECEALQGFPRGYTAIPWRGKPAEECPDGPRYKALGNSWAVPVARYIGERIAIIEAERAAHDRSAAA